MRTRRHPNERFLVLAGLSMASGLCVALELFRERHFGDLDFRFLLWNLMLAWIPLVLALVVYDSYRRGVRIALLTPAVLAWLLFLPNAPYIVTDFVHLSPSAPAPLWFDAVVISSFAWTGVLLGFASLYLLHAVVRHRFGTRLGWAAAFVALALAGVVRARHRRLRGPHVRCGSFELTACTGEERVDAALTALHRPAVVPAEERLEQRAELLHARLLDARAKVEHRTRSAGRRFEAPAAAADEVAGHREAEAARRLGIGDLRLPAQPVGQEAAADDAHMAAATGRAAVAVDADEDVAPPAGIAERVADRVVGDRGRRVHDPAVDEAVLVVHPTILCRPEVRRGGPKPSPPVRHA